MFIWMAVIFGLSHQANSGTMTEEYFGSFNVAIRKFGHVSEYFILFSLIRWALSGTIFNTASNLILSAVFSILYALSDEWHQSFVPGRSASLQDVSIDSSGVVLALVTHLIVQKLSNKKTDRGKTDVI